MQYILGWVYPPVSHWAWDGSGWLAETNYYLDFAGSGKTFNIRVKRSTYSYGEVNVFIVAVSA